MSASVDFALFSSKEIKQGKEDLIKKIQNCKPLVTCFNGKGNNGQSKLIFTEYYNWKHIKLTLELKNVYCVGIYEIFSGKKCELGRQSETIPGTDSVSFQVYVTLLQIIALLREFYEEL